MEEYDKTRKTFENRNTLQREKQAMALQVRGHRLTWRGYKAASAESEGAVKGGALIPNMGLTVYLS